MKKLLVFICIGLLFVGCSGMPPRPDDMAMFDAITNHGMKAEQVNQIYADYNKAQADYENSTECKLKLLAIAPLLILGGATMGYVGSGRVTTTTTSSGHGSYTTTYSAWSP